MPLLLLLLCLSHILLVLNRRNTRNSPVQLPLTVQVCPSPHVARKPVPVAAAVHAAVHVAPMGRLVQLAGKPVLFVSVDVPGAPLHVLTVRHHKTPDDCGQGDKQVDMRAWRR